MFLKSDRFLSYPDEIVCLKVPVDATEEEYIFEYLNILVSRPDIRRALGSRSPPLGGNRNVRGLIVTRKYVEFLDSDRAWICRRAPVAHPTIRDPDSSESAVPIPAETVLVEPEYIISWSPTEAARSYAATHLTRLERTLAITPPGGADDRILPEMGVYLQITRRARESSRLWRGAWLLLRTGRERWTAATVNRRNGDEVFTVDVDLFDAEKDLYPYYDDGHFATVLCCELLEHLTADPMHMMAEINRILKPDGHLVLELRRTWVLCGRFLAFCEWLSSRFISTHKATSRPSRGVEPDARVTIANTCRAKFQASSGRLRLRGDIDRDGSLPGQARTGIRVGGAIAGALRAFARPARRRDLRCGTEDRPGAGAVSRLVV